MSSLIQNYTLAWSGDGKTSSAYNNNPNAPTSQQNTLQRLDGSNTYSSNFWSLPALLKSADTVGIQFSCLGTGSPNGTVAFQGSNDVSEYESVQGPFNGQNVDTNLLNWATMSFWDEATGLWLQSKAVSGASSYLFTIPILSPRWLRMSWTNSSGSVAPIAKIAVKSDGGR